MNIGRRALLRIGLAAAGAFALATVWPRRALAAIAGLEKAFESTTLDAAFADLGGTPTPSEDVQLLSPEIAENGAVVPVTVTSRIPGTEEILVLVEKNPNPLAAAFRIPDGTEAFVSTRIKMSETCLVHAVVRADGKLYVASRETKVTLGGCGG